MQCAHSHRGLMFHAQITHLTLDLNDERYCTFPQEKVIPLGLRSLKISDTCLSKMDEELPQACKSLPPTPKMHMSLFTTTPNGNSRSSREHETGASSRPIGAFIFELFAICGNEMTMSSDRMFYLFETDQNNIFTKEK